MTLDTSKTTASGRQKPSSGVIRENPWRHMNQWYWHDEDERTHGPYPTQMAALHTLLKHIDPPWYKRLWTIVTGRMPGD